MPNSNKEVEVEVVVKTPAEILMELLTVGVLPEGFIVPLEEDFKPLLVNQFAKSEFLPKISFTVENAKALALVLVKAGYLNADVLLLSLFDVNESQTKWGKKVQYLTPKGDWLRTDAITAAVPNALDVRVGG